MKNPKHHQLFNFLNRFCWLTVVIAGILLLSTFFIGDELTLPWITSTDFIKTPLFLEYFSIDGKPMGFHLDQIVIWQQFKTGRFLFLESPAYILFSLTLISFVVITVTITYLERFWYLVCAGIMVFVSINFGLEELAIGDHYFSYAFIGSFLILSYYFQSIKPNSSFTLRIAASLILFGAFTLAAIFLSPIAHPTFVWLSYGLLAPLILAILYIFFVAGDNFFYLFKIATQNAPTGKNALFHFLIIGAIYILVLALLFLNLTGRISLDLILLHPYTILLVSVVSGYYVLNTKLEVVKAEIPMILIKNLLYPALAALALAVIFYAEITANDSLTLAIKMVIVTTHLAFAVVYYVYCFMNFTPYLLANEPAWRAFFRGEKAPLLTARLGTILFLAGTLFFLEYRPYYQIKAGRYNALGALSEKIENDLLAEQYYKQSLFYDYFNVRANYGLAMIEKANGNPAQATKRFKESLFRSKNNKPALALAQYYSDQDQLFKKLLSLKEIENAFDDQRVINNLAVAHYEFAHLDTALMLMDKAYKDQPTSIIASNFLALDLAIKDELDVDSVLLATANFEDYSTRTNRQALANSLGIQPELNLSTSADSFLLLNELYFLYNSSLNSKSSNQALIERLNRHIAYPRNIAIKDYLMLSKVIQLYNSGEVNETFYLLDQLIASYSQNTGLYSYMKAIWAYQQGAHELGFVFLGEAQSYNYDRNIIAATYSDFLSKTIDQTPAGLQEKWAQFDATQGDLSEEEKKAFLMDLANENAFDEAGTLKAIEALRAINTPSDEIYEALRKAISINKRSTLLYEAYIYQTSDAGLPFFGTSALETLSTFASKEAFERIKQQFEQKEKLNQ
ncbi:tetratricopeptide repeat protein [Roseivirga echinicomitans]